MFYKKIIRPILFHIDPEDVHNLAITGLKFTSSFSKLNKFFEKRLSTTDKRLAVRIGSLHFDNPVGLAAGFDKKVTAPLAYPMLGFGFAELGSITHNEQPGNPRPRLWRLPVDSGLIVYYGLANAGVEKTVNKLAKIVRPHPISYGVSVAPSTGINIKDMAKDYLRTLIRVHTFADYIALNVSCPNVSGCEKFAQVNFIRELIQTVSEWMKENSVSKDIFLKIGPHFSPMEMDQVMTECLKYGITGLIATNLIKERSGVSFRSSPNQFNHPGGISGKLLKNRSDDVIRYIWQSTHGKLAVIGLGGIFGASDAYNKIKLGASAVQIITGFIYEGPAVVKKINSGLIELMNRDGFDQLSEAVGKGV